MISIFLIILFSISHCNADVCYCNCCHGTSCTPALQGILNVPTCTSSPCTTKCKITYPGQCTDGTHNIDHKCSENATLNWIGEFSTTNQCDRNLCCCPGEKLTLSAAAETDMLRIQCPLIGNCLSDQPIDMNIPMPKSFKTQLEVLGAPLSIVLSEDSNTIEIINLLSSSCNERAIRNIANAPPIVKINMVLLLLLNSAMYLRQFIM